MSSLSVADTASSSSSLQIKKEDIDYMVSEFELERDAAEKLLRAAGGDCKRACSELILG